MDYGFVDLSTYLSGVEADVRYATANNITGRPLAGYVAGKAMATLQAADALRMVSQMAQAMGYGLLVYDAYRPQKAVDDLIQWSREPENGLTKEQYYPRVHKADLVHLGYIAEKSGHSRASTIDLTLTRDGVPLDMGGEFDLMDERSCHNAQGLTWEQDRNRRLLCALMAFAGFAPYEREWWHYRLMNEPFPQEYFNFNIT